jgi:transcription initiation factor IIE alpha subunit
VAVDDVSSLHLKCSNTVYEPRRECREYAVLTEHLIALWKCCDCGEKMELFDVGPIVMEDFSKCQVTADIVTLN